MQQSTSHDVTVVMYHYVRPLQRTRYPGIKGRTVDEFRGQLEHLRRTYRVIGVEELTAAFEDRRPFDHPTAVLTFDDGFVDHFTHVAPLLVDLGLPGAFYPPAAPVLDRRLLDVHRLHFVLASCHDAPSLARELDDLVRRHAPAVDLEEMRASLATPSRFDPAEVVYVKRMLQVALPRPTRSVLLGELFTSWVGVDEEVFAEELYLSSDQLRMMRGAGLHVGAHGDQHHWFGSLTGQEQRQELERSVALLQHIGVDISSGWSLCYPYGDRDESTVRTAAELGCTLAMTTEVRGARPDVDAALEVPRFDTNDLPFS
ncbi:polysaccharide deacetylase family protein [Kineococcus sp. SYSU DK001]|uniref:polysaccharide deacetylase family protein n=1 Tax=Kineococcus sp. SYSU DK001 TaxID=3383122 RepID=UPI003D7E6110